MTDKFAALKSVSEWLQSTAAGSTSLSPADPKVCTAHQGEPAANVIRTMVEQHFHCIPITAGGDADNANRVVNFITLADVVAVVATEIDKHSQWYGRVVGRGFLREALDHELFQCSVLDFVLTKAAPLHRRGDVAVVRQSVSMLYAMKQMVHLATQQVILVEDCDNVVSMLSASRVCELLTRFFAETAVAAQHVSSRFDIMMSSQLHATTPQATLARAFKFMLDKRVSALAVVDSHTHELVGSLSLSDVATLVDADLFFATAKGTVGEFLAAKSSMPHAVQRPDVISVTPSDTFGTVLRLIVDYAVHRVWVVDPVRKSPVGIVSVWDVIRFVATQGESKAELLIFDE
jgi:CBS domain-containing protein